tara:strand:+ start:86 stop:307 length:222 start_codon:yes stop_codon:yes gene_type:complete
MEKQEESVNLIEEKIKELIMLLQTNQHMKDKVVAQAAWDKYLKLLRFTSLFDRSQQIFMDKTKRVLLGNRKWI